MSQFKKALVAVIGIFYIVSVSALTAQNCSDTHLSLTPEPQEAEWWMPRHLSKLTEDGRETAEILLIGDSITHGWENKGQEVWPKYFADYGTYNIGYSADRTEHVLWRFENGELDGIDPKVAVVMIGTNNTGHRQDPAECTAKGIGMIVDQIKQKLPETNILLLGIFPRESSSNGELRQLNNRINERIEKLGEEKMVTYSNINHVFLDSNGTLPEEIMPDLLHPNEKGYDAWATEMKPMILELLK